MTEGEIISDRLAHLEREVEIIKATAGRVAFPPALLALLWAILLATIGAAMFVVKLDSRVEYLMAAVETNQRILLAHTSEPWHASEGEKWKSIEERQKDIEDRMNGRNGRGP